MRPAISGEYQFKKVAHTHDMFRLLNDNKDNLTNQFYEWMVGQKAKRDELIN